MTQTSAFFSGTSNIVLPVPNKQAFPPEFKDKSRLEYYGFLFNSAEVNSSFYKIPQASTIRRWAQSVPEQFRFTFKLFKEVTHCKEAVFNTGPVARFMDTISEAGQKKGALLVQFPPSRTISTSQLEHLLREIRRSDPDSAWDVSVEFRSRSWYQEETYELLDEYGAAMVLHDLPASASPMSESSAPFVYLRFHGPEGGYRGSYSDDYLSEYASYIDEWMQEGKRVYAYFNNTMGNAVRNLMTLNDLVRKKY